MLAQSLAALFPVKKANPHHDERGRFSTEDKAKFTSIGGVFARSNERQKEREKNRKPAEPTPEEKNQAVADKLLERKYANTDNTTPFGKHDQNAESRLADRSDEAWAYMSKTERKTISDYTHTNYTAINDTLRSGREDMRGYEKEKRESEYLGGILERTEVGVDTVAYRGFNNTAIYSQLKQSMKDGTLIGSVIDDPGFQSASLNKNVAEGFAQAGGLSEVLMQVRVPKETKGIFLNNDEKTHFPEERELLLQKGSRMRVIGGRMVKSKYSENESQLVLDVIVDQGQHGFGDNTPPRPNPRTRKSLAEVFQRP